MAVHEDAIENEETTQFYWQSQQEQDVVMVPSMSYSEEFVLSLKGAVHYEERQLFHILLLQNPLARLFFVTSCTIDPTILHYYLSLLPPHVDKKDAAKRLICISLNDSSPKSLLSKFLARPELINQIRRSLKPGLGILQCFNTTVLECELAKQLGIPLFGSEEGLTCWGSKSGSRIIFEEANVPHPRGVDLSHTSGELADKIVRLCLKNPMKKIVVKLDNGFSGQGNAILDLSQTPPHSQISKEFVLERLSTMAFNSAKETWDSFRAKIENLGAIAEEFIETKNPKSPSVQGCISFDGNVEIISSHEQILQGQVYLGCRFPAEDPHRMILHQYGISIGKSLAAKGVRGHFGVDFVVRPPTPNPTTERSVPSDSLEEERVVPDFPVLGRAVEVYALEINLRVGGTTHPFFTTLFLTGGTYSTESGLCYSNKGTAKYYVASDNICKKRYTGMKPSDLIRATTLRNLAYTHTTQSGAVFHLLGALNDLGKVGMTCIGDSPEEAQSIFQKVKSVIEEVALNIGTT